MEHTAKNFALQLGSLISLYVSLGALLALLFGVINLTFPDAAAGYWQYESAASAIRFSIAMLVVFFPAYVVLTRLVNKSRRADKSAYGAFTKWLIYLSLLVGGGVLLGDLVAVVNTFLNGELAIRFALKALAVLVVVGAAFTYYLMDVRGYWEKNEKKSIWYGAIASLIVLVSLVVGFMNIETPAEVREMRLDARQLEDFQDISWRIEEYYRVNEVLPETLPELYNGIEIPTAPEDRPAYVYTVTDDASFELCATFAHESSRTDSYDSYARPVFEKGMIRNPYNWDHGDGEWCFEREIVTDTVTQ